MTAHISLLSDWNSCKHHVPMPMCLLSDRYYTSSQCHCDVEVPGSPTAINWSTISVIPLACLSAANGSSTCAQLHRAAGIRQTRIDRSWAKHDTPIAAIRQSATLPFHPSPSLSSCLAPQCSLSCCVPAICFAVSAAALTL